jgi:Flp pilus assembly protein TadD
MTLGLGACATDPGQPFATGVTGARDTAASSLPVPTLLRVAEAARESGDLLTAAELYRQAAARQPGDVAPLVGLGETLLALGAVDEAAESFRAALSAAPEDTAALVGLGKALLALNQPAIAAAQFERAIARQPGNVQALNGLGIAYDLSGDFRRAQESYRRGLALAPENLTLRNNLGLSLALSGDAGEAVAQLEQIVATPMATAQHRQNLALAYGLAGNMDVAREIALIDLDEESVRNNLAYYAAIRDLADPAARAAAIRAQVPEDASGAAGPTDAGAGRGGLQPGPLLSAGADVFLHLGDYRSAAEADAAWRGLRTQHAPLLDGLRRHVLEDPRHVVIGPAASLAEAEDLCRRLRAQDVPCAVWAM